MTSDGHGVEYVFHPVGQGLFASGALGNFRHGQWIGERVGDIRFQWVYDCGTVSADKHLDWAIHRFVAKRAQLTKQLGLLALSHFDRDHISGVVRLLSHVDVDVLLLPYIPLHERVLLAIEEEIGADDPLLRFFVDPVAYLREADIRGVRRLVFVRGGSSEGRRNGESPPLPDAGEQRSLPDGEFLLEFESRPFDEAGAAPSGAQGNLGQVLEIDSGSPLYLAALWEFVPYNDIDQGTVLNSSFKEEVGLIADRLRKAPSDAARGKALDDLKLRYDKQFGKGSKSRNVISLFLYAGSIHPWYSEGRSNFSVEHSSKGDIATYQRARSTGGRMRGSILYTGDGYLNTDARMLSLKDCLKKHRIESVAVLQVMHHGANGNWKPGVAATLDPLFSVFSSDPSAKKPGHPHAEVLRDFWQHAPIQVDKRAMATFHFY